VTRPGATAYRVGEWRRDWHSAIHDGDALRPITITAPPGRSGRRRRPATPLPATARRPWDRDEAQLKVAVMNRHPLVASACPRGLVLSLALLFVFGPTVGCTGRVSLLPNSDKALRRTPAHFASEAAKRTYRTDLPDGGTAEARAQVAYDGNYIQILNLSDEDWTDVEVWVNRKYVVHLPRIDAGQKRVKSVTFMMLYDDQGNPFPPTTASR
jgi:hypothetical protein